jgi:glutathione synthase/RimK-type ligase-like ATP-grasp enzyme
MKIGLLVGREYSFPPAFLARVSDLGEPHGISAEMVSLGGTRMDEPARYRVIVDRISHEVEYYRGAMKHAALHGAYVINNPFWWTADDKFFNYSVMAKLGCAIPKTVLLPQKGYPRTWIWRRSRCATSSIRSTGRGCSITSGGRRS